VWWPRSRDLGFEVAQLVNQFPGGRIVEIGYSASDWDEPARHIVTEHGRVRALRLHPNSRPGMVLRLDDDRLLRLVVVQAVVQAVVPHVVQAVVQRTPRLRPAAATTAILLYPEH
jgi:hypothetical protein